MKRVLLFLFLGLSFVLNAQIVKENFAGWSNVSASNGTNSITISAFQGNPKAFDNSWLSADIAVGDIVWANCSRFVVTAKVGLVLTLSDPDNSFSSVFPTAGQRIGFTREVLVNGQLIGTVPQFGDGNAGSIAGVENTLAACIAAHYEKVNQLALQNAVSDTTRGTNGISSQFYADSIARANTLASNGLTKATTTTELGGTLTKPTTITGTLTNLLNLNTKTVIGKTFDITAPSAGTGTFNEHFGEDSGNSNTTGYRNASFGAQSMFLNSTGYLNAAGGFQALSSNTTGYENSSFGSLNLGLNTTGYKNSAYGHNSMASNLDGFGNSAIGSNSLQANTTGGVNQAIGTSSLFENTTGSYNVALGYKAGFYGNESDNFWVDDRDRVTLAQQKTSSLLYGKFSDFISGQFLNVNGKLSVNTNNINLSNDQALEWGAGSTFLYGNSASSQMRMYTNNLERVRLTSGNIYMKSISQTMDDDFGLQWGTAGSSFIFGSSANNYLRFYTNNVERIRIIADGRVGFGTGTPQTIADFTSTTSGITVPRMTAAQVLAITTQPDGGVLYDNTALKFRVRENGKWNNIVTQFDIQTQVSPLNGATVSINWDLRYSAYKLIATQATNTIDYSNAITGAIYNLVIAPFVASSNVTFTGFVENGAAVTTKTFTSYTILTIRQLSTTSAEIVEIYTPSLAPQNAKPLGSFTAATTSTTVPLNITNGVNPATNTDISRLKVYYQSLGSGIKMPLIPNVDFTLTSISGSTVSIVVGTAPAITDKFYLIID